MTDATSGDRLLTPRFLLVVVVGLLYFSAVASLLPVIPRYVEEALGGGSVAVGLAVGAFFVGAVVVRPFAGRLGDRRGRKVLIVGGALIVGVSIGLLHLVDSVGAIVGARLFGGIGEAAFFVGAGTMVTDLAPESRRGEAISYWSISVYGGLALGPIIGESVLGDDGYARVWTVAAVLALAAGLLALGTAETVDRPTPTRDATPGTRRHLLHRDAIAPGLILFLGLVALAGFIEFLPLYVDDVGLDGSRGVFTVYAVVVLAVRIFGAKLPDRLGPLAAGTGAGAGVVLGMLIVAAVPSVAGLYVGTVVFAGGMSLMYPALLLLTLTGVPANERGSAVGTFSTFFDLSQGLGAPLLGVVAALSGYRGAFAVGGVLALAGVVLLRSGIDPRTRRPVDHDAAPAVELEIEPELQ